MWVESSSAGALTLCWMIQIYSGSELTHPHAPLENYATEKSSSQGFFLLLLIAICIYNSNRERIKDVMHFINCTMWNTCGKIHWWLGYPYLKVIHDVEWIKKAN